MDDIFSLNEIVFNFIKNIKNINDLSDLERMRIEYLGKKGHMTIQMNDLRYLPADDKRRESGKQLNEAKKQLLEAYKVKKNC